MRGTCRRVAVEDGGEQVAETRPFLDRDSPEDMRGLAHAEGVNVRLNADACPSAMQATVEPEARFVAEHHESATG